MNQIKQRLEIEKSRMSQGDDKREIVKEKHDQIVQEKVEKFMQKIEESDLKVAKAKARNEYAVRVKANMEYMREVDRLENVRRIEEMHKHKKKKMLEKIEADNQRSRMIRQEHENLYKMRLKIREEMEARKQQMLDEFQQKRKKAFRPGLVPDQSGLDVSSN